MEEDLNFIEEFLLHLEKSSDEGFSYSIPFNSKDRYLMLHISSLDIANFVKHEELHTHDSFNGIVRITQKGLNFLKTIVK